MVCGFGGLAGILRNDGSVFAGCLFRWMEGRALVLRGNVDFGGGMEAGEIVDWRGEVGKQD